MFKWFRKIRMGILHAAYHRNMKKAIAYSKDKDLGNFKKYIYRAEDAWRKLVMLTEKNKQ